MGYRHYFFQVKKSEIEAVKTMSDPEFYAYAQNCGVAYEEDGEKDIFFYDNKLLNKTKLFELGEISDDDTASRIYSKGSPLFVKEEVQDKFSYYNPYVVGKEGLLEAIKIWEEKALEYYKRILSDDEELHTCISNKIRTISFTGLANINEKDKMGVAIPCDYEYAIYNLVHVLKTMDWDQDTILFFGY